MILPASPNVCADDIQYNCSGEAGLKAAAKLISSRVLKNIDTLDLVRWSEVNNYGSKSEDDYCKTDVAMFIVGMMELVET